MNTYVLLTTLTSEGAGTLHGNPDRLGAVNTEVVAFGCRVVAQYATLGPYDFVTVIEAPDAATVAHLSIDLSSRGTLRVTSMPALPVEELMAKLKGPKQMGKD